jgi:hypothetical protein
MLHKIYLQFFFHDVKLRDIYTACVPLLGLQKQLKVAMRTTALALSGSKVEVAVH